MKHVHLIGYGFSLVLFGAAILWSFCVPTVSRVQLVGTSLVCFSLGAIAGVVASATSRSGER
jgi:hypothetical protein